MFPGGPRIREDLALGMTLKGWVGDAHTFTVVSMLFGLLLNRKTIGQQVKAENAE